MSPILPELAPSSHILSEDILYFDAQEILRDDFDGKLKPILDVVFVRLFDGENDYALLKCFLNDFLQLEGEHRITSVQQVRTRYVSTSSAGTCSCPYYRPDPVMVCGVTQVQVQSRRTLLSPTEVDILSQVRGPAEPRGGEVYGYARTPAE